MNIDLTSGSIQKVLLFFAIPLFFSQLFQTLYNTADTIIIGYFLGDQALAAVGCVAALFELIVGFSTGFGQGCSIIAAQCYGAKDENGFRQSVALSILLCFLLGIVMAFGMCSALPWILRWLLTPEELFGPAYSYIFVIAAGILITIFYNLCAGILRAAGDSKTPLYVLILSSLLNIGLDVLFIATFHQGVASTAWATLIAQLVSLVVCLVWIGWRKKELVPHWTDFRLDWAKIGLLMRMGLSMALMSSIVSIGSLILQTGLNQQGSLRIAGHTAARKIFGLLNLPLVAMMLALSSYVAQNMGAQDYERTEKGIAFANRCGLYFSIISTLIIYLTAEWWIQTISATSNPFVIETGSMYMRINSPFFVVLALVLNLRTSLQSMLMNVVPVLSSVIELLGKIIFTQWIVPTTGYLGICFTEPIVWLAMALFLMYFYLKKSPLTQVGLSVHLFR